MLFLFRYFILENKATDLNTKIILKNILRGLKIYVFYEIIFTILFQALLSEVFLVTNI